MKIESKSYVKNGVKYHEQMVPHMMVVVDTFHPNPTNPPWDYQGIRHQREYFRVLENAGIECVCLCTSAVLLHPVGTGPNGSVRLGDNMTPGIYKIAVCKRKVVAAKKAIAEHKVTIQKWLDGKAEFPAACRG
jgi:hypothetical protein